MWFNDESSHFTWWMMKAVISCGLMMKAVIPCGEWWKQSFHMVKAVISNAENRHFIFKCRNGENRHFIPRWNQSWISYGQSSHFISFHMVKASHFIWWKNPVISYWWNQSFHIMLKPVISYGQTSHLIWSNQSFPIMVKLVISWSTQSFHWNKL